MKTIRMTPDDKSLLCSLGLTAADIDAARAVQYAKGEILCREGLPMMHLHILTDGRAKVCVSIKTGRTLLLSFYDGRGIVGDVELLHGQNCTTTMQAVTAVRAICLPMAYCRTNMCKNTEFILQLAKALAEKLDRCSKNGAANILQPLRMRLCTYINMTQENGVFSEKLTTLSELLGTSYRHLLRCLDGLQNDGILEKTATATYRILNMAALERAAGDDSTMQE